MASKYKNCDAFSLSNLAVDKEKKSLQATGLDQCFKFLSGARALFV